MDALKHSYFDSIRSRPLFAALYANEDEIYEEDEEDYYFDDDEEEEEEEDYVDANAQGSIRRK